MVLSLEAENPREEAQELLADLEFYKFADQEGVSEILQNPEGVDNKTRPCSLPSSRLRGTKTKPMTITSNLYHFTARTVVSLVEASRESVPAAVRLFPASCVVLSVLSEACSNSAMIAPAFFLWLRAVQVRYGQRLIS